MTIKDWKNETGDSFEEHALKLLEPVYPCILKDFCNAFSRPTENLILAEIGCGPGFMNSHFLTCRFSRIIEIDISFGMLQKAKVRCEKSLSHFIQADAGHLPLLSSCIDAVFSRGSIFFWSDLSKSLGEISRILKKDGFAFIGGGYGLSTPAEILEPIKQHSKQSQNRSSIPRIDLDQLIEIAEKFFSKCEILQKPKQGFWLKCIK